MTGCRPESMRAWVRAAASSMRSLGMPASMASGHAAGRLDLLDVRPRPAGQVVGQLLDVGAAAPRVDRPGWCRTPAAAAAGCCGRCGPRSRSAAPAPRRGRWCAATGCGPGSRPSPRCRCGSTLLKTSCAVSDQPEVWQCVRSDSDLAFFGSNCCDQLGPQQPGRAQLGDLHEEVHADGPEERQPRRERVDVQPGRQPGPEVLHAVGQRVGQLQVGRRPGLLDVVAGDGDRVEPRHLAARCSAKMSEMIRIDGSGG